MSGRIVILNGVPRSGKSSIARALQQHAAVPWINLGVDAAMATTPTQYLPGIGLRPGGERPDLEPFVEQAYAGLFGAIAAHARAGLDVVSDLGIHDGYSRPLGILPLAARTLAGLPVLFAGIRCPLGIILARRAADPQAGYYATDRALVERWEAAVHGGVGYDLELDTSRLTPDGCALRIEEALEAAGAPSAFERLAGRPQD